jgi:hypothetical protein
MTIFEIPLMQFLDTQTTVAEGGGGEFAPG